MVNFELSEEAHEVLAKTGEAQQRLDEESNKLRKAHRELKSTIREMLRERRYERTEPYRERVQELRVKRDAVIEEHVEDIDAYGRRVLLGEEATGEDLEAAALELKRAKSKHRIRSTETRIHEGPSELPEELTHVVRYRRGRSRTRRATNIRAGKVGESRFRARYERRRGHSLPSITPSETRQLMRGLANGLATIDAIPARNRRGLYHGLVADWFTHLRLRATVQAVGEDPEEELASTFNAYSRLLKAGAWAAWLRDDGNYDILKAPETIELNDEDQLHCEDGPALAWANGDAYYFWNGIHVPREVAVEPEALTVEVIETEENAERRRVMMERYGVEAFFEDADAVLVDQDEDQAGNERQLFAWGEELGSRDEWTQMHSFRRRQRIDCCVVKVTCPSTGREFTLQVPPDVESCQDAIAWTFDKEPEEYAPVMET